MNEDQGSLPALPAEIWAKHVAPFLARRDFDNFSSLNREIHELCQTLRPFWPCVKLKSFSKVTDFCFSNDSNWLIVAGKDHDGTTSAPMIQAFHVRYGPQPPIFLSTIDNSSIPDLFAQYRGIQFSNDDRFFVILTSASAEVKVYDLGVNWDTFQLADNFRDLTVTTFSADSAYKASFIPDQSKHWIAISYMEVRPGFNFGPRESHTKTAIFDYISGQCIKVSTEDSFDRNISTTENFVVSKAVHDGSCLRVWDLKNAKLSDNTKLLRHPKSSTRINSFEKSPTNSALILALCTVTSHHEGHIDETDTIDLLRIPMHLIGLAGDEPQHLELLASMNWEYHRNQSPIVRWCPDGMHFSCSGDFYKSLQLFGVDENGIHRMSRRKCPRKHPELLIKKACKKVGPLTTEAYARYQFSSDRNTVAIQNSSNVIHLVSPC